MIQTQLYGVAVTALALSSMSIRISASFVSPVERIMGAPSPHAGWIHVQQGQSSDFIFGMNSNCPPTQVSGRRTFPSALTHLMSALQEGEGGDVTNGEADTMEDDIDMDILEDLMDGESTEPEAVDDKGVQESIEAVVDYLEEEEVVVKDLPQVTEAVTVLAVEEEGGQYSYDVNRLKRNLVQETVRSYKKQFLKLLETPGASRQELQRQLASLVQYANPVATTTDSNLVDGAWTLAVQSDCDARTILDESQFDWESTIERNKQERSNRSRGITSEASSYKGKSASSVKVEDVFCSTTRLINLENLADDEDAHVLDVKQHMGGLFSFTKYHDVVRLTRTTICLRLASSSVLLFGKVRIPLFGKRKGAGFYGPSTSRSSSRPVEEEEVRVLYLDPDLCISTVGTDLAGPVYVYTKSDVWVGRSARSRRKLSFLSNLESPLRIRRRLRHLVNKSSVDENYSSTGKVTEEENRVLFRKRDDVSDVTVLKLGEAYQGEEIAWDGDEDPFVHLGPIERQEAMKGLTLEEIETMGEEQARRTLGDRKKRYRSRKPFKLPRKL